jgi:hypothetical protein
MWWDLKIDNLIASLSHHRKDLFKQIDMEKILPLFQKTEGELDITKSPKRSNFLGNFS